MSFRTIALTFALSTCFSNTAFASPNPTQPEAQFDLAQQLALKPNPESPTDARYWLEQSAHQVFARSKAISRRLRTRLKR